VFQQRRDVQLLTARVLASGELAIAATTDRAAFERRYPATRPDGEL
jgi:hypothetical protein